MKFSYSIPPVALFLIILGCARTPEPVNIEGWERYQEPYFKAHFSYPKGWHLVSEGNKVSVFSTPDVMEKFYDPTAKARIGVQLMVSFEKMDTLKTLDQYVESWKNELISIGFTIESSESKTIDGSPAAQIHYGGRFDERTKLEVVRAVSFKDSILYVVHYGAFNELFAPNRFLFDSLLTSVTLYKPPAAGTQDVLPSATLIDFSNKYLQISHPDNFQTYFPPPKGGSEFSLELRGYRNDCTIHIDVLPAQGLSLDKVVEQNQKFYKSTGRGKATIDGTSAVYLNYTPTRGVESRVYFLVKNDRVYRMIFNIYQPLKKDYLPAFEKTIASVRVK